MSARRTLRLRGPLAWLVALALAAAFATALALFAAVGALAATGLVAAALWRRLRARRPALLRPGLAEVTVLPRGAPEVPRR